MENVQEKVSIFLLFDHLMYVMSSFHMRYICEKQGVLVWAKSGVEEVGEGLGDDDCNPIRFK